MNLLLDTQIALWATKDDKKLTAQALALLVAQAISERMRLLTHDAVLAQYSDTVVLV